jgi:hypothetical protein
LVARALGLPSTGIGAGVFEQKFVIDGRFGTSPNIDFILRYEGDFPKVVAIECKYSETFGRAHSGFPAKYHAVPHIWDGLENTRRLATQITGGVMPKSVHATLRLDGFLVDVCVKSSSSSSSAFNSARHSGGVQCQSVRRSLAIASRVRATISSHRPDTTAARS